MNTGISKTVLQSAMTSLVSQRNQIDTQIQAIKTLTGYEAPRNTVNTASKSEGGFTAKIKDILSASPGATSTQVRERLEAAGYVRPRAGGAIKRYEVPIALGRLAKSGDVVRVGGSKVSGFQYALPPVAMRTGFSRSV